MYFQLMLENAQDENERKDLIMLEACEIQMERANLALDTYNKVTALEQYSRGIKAVASNVSGDFDQLTAFYEEEAVKSADTQKKKSLIKKAWETIKKFWKEVKRRISGFISKIRADKNLPDDAEGQISQDALTLPEKISQMIGNIKAFCGSPKVQLAGKVLAGITVVASAALAILKGKNLINVKGKQLKEFFSRFNKSTDDMTQTLDKFERLEESQIDVIPPGSPLQLGGPTGYTPLIGMGSPNLGTMGAVTNNGSIIYQGTTKSGPTIYQSGPSAFGSVPLGIGTNIDQDNMFAAIREAFMETIKNVSSVSDVVYNQFVSGNTTVVNTGINEEYTESEDSSGNREDKEFFEEIENILSGNS